MAQRSGMDLKLAVARLREIMVDPARFGAGEKAVAGYAAHGATLENLVAVVFPRSSEDVGQVLELARNLGISVYTPVPRGLNPPRPGVVVDYSYMADIKSVDTKNLFLEVEPGVTWEQVMPVLAGQGVKVALPAAARSPYVLESALDREVVLPASRFSNKQLSTFHALLADGRLYMSGSDALPNSVAHWREDGGPNISRVFTGSRNSFGLPVRGFVFLYPEPEYRRVVTRGLPNRLAACRMAQMAARSEVGTEVLVLNKMKAKDVVGGDPGLPTWIVAFGLEGSQKLVKYQEARLEEIALELKLKPKKSTAKVDNAVGAAIGSPWYAKPASLGFYTNWSGVEKLSGTVEKALAGKGKFAQMVIPVKRGASVYVHYDVLDGTKEAANVIKRLLPRLADQGAFFANPTGSLATHIFGKQPDYYDLLKNIKRFMDPDDMLNSGQVVEVQGV